MVKKAHSDPYKVWALLQKAKPEASRKEETDSAQESKRNKANKTQNFTGNWSSALGLLH